MSAKTQAIVDKRVASLIETFSAANASAADLLCDRHPAARLAYRVIEADLRQSDLTYGELREESEKFAAALSRLGIGPGDRVATLMGKSREFLIVLMGIWRLGAVHVPLFTAFAPAAIAVRLIGSQAKAVVSDSDHISKLSPSADMPNDPSWKLICNGKAEETELSLAELMYGESPGYPAAALGGDAPFIHIYTSGTTGAPKGVVVPLRALASFQTYAEFGLGLRADDVFWCAADPGWAYGLYFGILATFTTGVPSILLAGNFAPESTMAVLAGQKVTNFAAAPTVYRSLRSSRIAVPTGLALRCASSAGEPLTPDVNQWAERELGVTVHDHYGQTETGMLINNHQHELLRYPIRTGSMGHGMPGWRAVVLDLESDHELPPGQTGRIAMDLSQSPLQWLSGYDGVPGRWLGKVSDDGRWYFTGDLGSISEDGYFSFGSRDDDVILMAGYRIGPFEVESILVLHPSVSEAAVIAVPDDVRGEIMEAFVTLEAGHVGSPELEDEIKHWVKTKYAAHAFPRRVHFASQLPKTPSGKVQRFVLKQQRLEELGLAK
ncbi:AMP-binding protein [Aquisediminimonas profunda]|uniref:AMP-binding protein n=1 Tax=Aquisediminimonas profunda TaxID=1550733 RepID=UPI001C62FE2B|nr:AMP-binding protein [Aquisediminimonas profunda]